MNDDALVDAIRRRVADPGWRVDVQPSRFDASLKEFDSHATRTEMGRAADYLRRVSTGDLGADAMVQAESYWAAMTDPADVPLPAPASRPDLEDAERAMGLVLPALLRRLYTEVANGGFGPGSGLVGVKGGWSDQWKCSFASSSDLAFNVRRAWGQVPVTWARAGRGCSPCQRHWRPPVNSAGQKSWVCS